LREELHGISMKFDSFSRRITPNVQSRC